MVSARTDHTTTLLPNGTVLVAGGTGSGGWLTSAELFNPATGTWIATNALKTARAYHTATLMPSGKVLVAGGYNNISTALATTELYDPDSGTWTSTGTLTTARHFHTATLLPNGKVLVTAGYGIGVVAVAARAMGQRKGRRKQGVDSQTRDRAPCSGNSRLRRRTTSRLVRHRPARNLSAAGELAHIEAGGCS